MKVNPKQSTLSQSVLLPILNSPQNGACLGRKGRSRRFTTTSLRFPPLILSSLRRCSKVVLQECSSAAESEGEAFKRNSYPNTKGFPFFSYPWEETLPFNVNWILGLERRRSVPPPNGAMLCNVSHKWVLKKTTYKVITCVEQVKGSCLSSDKVIFLLIKIPWNLVT